jgi:hypothetical protein
LQKNKLANATDKVLDPGTHIVKLSVVKGKKTVRTTKKKSSKITPHTHLANQRRDGGKSQVSSTKSVNLLNYLYSHWLE